MNQHLSACWFIFKGIHTQTCVHRLWKEIYVNLGLIEAVVSLLKPKSSAKSQHNFCQLQYQGLAQRSCSPSPVSAHLKFHTTGTSAGDLRGTDSGTWRAITMSPIPDISVPCQVSTSSSLSALLMQLPLTLEVLIVRGSAPSALTLLEDMAVNKNNYSRWVILVPW